MDREKEKINDKNLEEIPEAEMMDYDNERAQIIMYSKWDRIKEWLKRKIK